MWCYQEGRKAEVLKAKQLLGRKFHEKGEYGIVLYAECEQYEWILLFKLLCHHNHESWLLWCNIEVRCFTYCVFHSYFSFDSTMNCNVLQCNSVKLTNNWDYYIFSFYLGVLWYSLLLHYSEWIYNKINHLSKRSKFHINLLSCFMPKPCCLKASKLYYRHTSRL